MKHFYHLIFLVSILVFAGCNNNLKPNAPIGDVSYEITYSEATLIKSNLTDTYRYHLFVEITNTSNATIYLDEGSLELEDGEGTLVGAKNFLYFYPNLLKPGEKGYMQTSVELVNEPTGPLKIIPRFLAEYSDVEPVRLVISDINIQDKNYTGPEALGRIENNTKEDLSAVNVVFIYFDSNNKPIGLVTDYLSHIPANNTRAFNAVSYDISDEMKVSDISSYLCYAYEYYVQ